MFKLSSTAQKLIQHSIVISLAFAGIYALIDIENFIAFFLGLIFGLVFTSMKVILLEKNIQRAVQLSGTKADNYMKLHFLFRYVLTAVVLAVTGMASSIALIGCILGLISLQISAYTTNFNLSKRNK